MSEAAAWIEAILSDRRRCNENHMSNVKRLSFLTVRGDGERVKESLIVKRLPENQFMRAWTEETGVNFVEFTMYRDAFPAMERIARELEIWEEPLWPKYFSMTPYSEIVLEDLTTRGFKMADRVAGLDFDHCSLVMRNLGFYHALTLALVEAGGLPRKAFDRHFLCKDTVNERYSLARPFATLLKEVERWGESWTPVLDKLRGKLDEYEDGVFDSLKSKRSGFQVLAHADCWTNNFLFKYSPYTGKPEQMKLIDYQASTLLSPAVDLVYFFITSPDLETRPRTSELMRVYYDSLIFNMKRLQLPETVPRPTFEFIEEEYQRLIYLKFHMAAAYLPLILVRVEGSDPLEVFQREYPENLTVVLKHVLREAVESGSV